MNVFDWLSALPLHDSAKPYPVIEVSFNKGSRKEFYRNNSHHILEKGEMIAVEGVGGFDVGQVSLTGELVKLQMKKYGVEDNPSMKRVLRMATEEDLKVFNDQKQREQDVMIRARAISRSLKLEMKVCEVEIQADGRKATFFYTADQRVDFRELIKVFASEFKVKVEMRQIGARQESAKVGGIGSCGRELCCSTWLTDFKSVNTTAARYQNLSINQTKLSGQCGRLKCCLNYELDTYMDALRVFPENADAIHTIQGTASLQKRDIFKNLMWYSYAGSNKQYPLSITRVNEIIALNKQGVKPDELQPVELETNTEKKGIKVDVGFVNDVGQISLKALEKSSKKKQKSGSGNKQAAGGNNPQQAGGNPQKRQQQNAPAEKMQGRNPQQGQGGEKPQKPQQQQKQNQPRPEKQQQQKAQGQQGGGERPQQQQKQSQPRPQQQGGEKQPPRQQNQNQPRPEKQQNQPRPDRPQKPANPDAQQQGEGSNTRQRSHMPRPPRPPRTSAPQDEGPKE
ncbi:PSP1 domain-containing protein [Chitinophagaceae bacterium MMS25-I14]